MPCSLEDTASANQGQWGYFVLAPGFWAVEHQQAAQADLLLSAREDEVLILLSKGYANKEIADKLSISTETVGSHLKHIYKKMHVRSRAEAVARYMTGQGVM